MDGWMDGWMDEFKEKAEQERERQEIGQNQTKKLPKKENYGLIYLIIIDAKILNKIWPTEYKNIYKKKDHAS